MIDSEVKALNECQWSEATCVDSDLTACLTKAFLASYNSYPARVHVISKPAFGLPVLFFI